MSSRAVPIALKNLISRKWLQVDKYFEWNRFLPKCTFIGLGSKETITPKSSATLCRMYLQVQKHIAHSIISQNNLIQFLVDAKYC